MPDRILSLSFRPQTLDTMIGQKHLATVIRNQVLSGRDVAAWMFVGDTGSGKTTVARILALAFQCDHSKFGNPCEHCQANRAVYDITEINASAVAGVQDIGKVVQGADYAPRPPSSRRVYILDEAQRLSKDAQNLLLKNFEDSPKTTVWIVCTTEPQKILRTLRSRCVSYTIPGLGVKGVGRLVKSAIKYCGGRKKSSDALIDCLLEQDVRSPRSILMAVEKYLAGEEPELAAQVTAETNLDTLKICRCLFKGDWLGVREEIVTATPADARAIRASAVGYFKSVLLGSARGSKATKVARSIEDMVRVSAFEDGVQFGGTVAVFYEVCKRMDKRE